MKRIKRYELDTENYPFSHHVPMDLRSGIRTYVDVDRLPLSDKQKRLVLRVQGAYAKKEAYTLAHRRDRAGRVLVTIKDIKGLEKCAVDLLSGKVYDKTRQHEIEPRYHLTKGKADYLMVGTTGLHRIVALAWLRVSGQLDLYRKALARPRAYPCHHIKPWTKLDQRGNNIFNVKILPCAVHYRYESIATQLATKYKRGELTIDDETSLKNGGMIAIHKTHVL